MKTKLDSDTTHLGNIGHLLLGIGAVIGLSHTKEALNGNRQSIAKDGACRQSG